MGQSPTENFWPEVPQELKYSELRLTGTFRELAANRNLTHEEIGRIVRCIALNTELFITPRIEPEVHFYSKHQKLKLQVRKRVEALRKRKSDVSEVVIDDGKKSVTVTSAAKPPASEQGVPSPLEKTPSILKEKIPPIVPLERKSPSPLEKPKRTRKRSAADDLQQDLFALAESTCATSPRVGGQGVAQNRSAVSGAGNPVQDIESDSRPVFDGNANMPTGSDSRADAAWIPQKFAAFWERYPRKVAKQAAMRAFVKIIKSQNDIDGFMRTLIASLEWWKSQPNWKRDAGKFIPHPATWLNRGSWEDSVDNKEQPAGHAEFLDRNSDSEEDLIRRMTGG